MRFLTLLLVPLLISCGPKRVETPTPTPQGPTPLNTEGIIWMIGRYGNASACGVNRYVVTAGHVITPFQNKAGLYELTASYAWSDQSGQQGYLLPGGVSNTRDVGVLYVDSGSPTYYPLSTSACEVGDEVRWIENNKEQGDFFDAVEKTAKVKKLIAGHLVFDTAPTPGSSGACVFNRDAEVVGIITWSLPTIGYGIAVSLTGPWWLE